MSRSVLFKKPDMNAKPPIGSNRSFGFVFSIVFGLVACWPLLNDHPIRLWALILMVVFVLASLFCPNLLSPLNRAWFYFGLFLHKLVSPIIIGLLFFIVVTPIAIIMRVLGKRPLDLKFNPDVSTYWVSRKPAEPEPETMKRQF